MNDTGEDRMTRGLWFGLGIFAFVVAVCGLLGFLGLKVVGVL